MDTLLLEAFVAVAETGSFSEAAEKVHITQPAVSKRIAQLESLLDCRLFDRISRAVYLTEAGKALLPRAQKILRELKETRQAIHDLSGEISGSLSIAISHHIGLHRLPPVLKAFASSNPKVSLAVEFMDSEIAYEGVLHGDYEIAVITLAPEPHPQIYSFCLWDDPLTPMAASDHPLATKAKVSIQHLSNFPAILPGLETYTGRLIKRVFDDSGYGLQASMATNYLETIKMLVSVGLGWSILPTIMLDEGLSILPCDSLNFSRQLGYIHHKEKTLSNAATAFLQLLQK